MTNNEKALLLSLISEGNIETAIDKLLSLKVKENIRKEAIAISSRYQTLKANERKSILSFEEVKLTESQIINQLIDLVSHSGENLPEEKKSVGKSASDSVHNGKKSTGYWVGAIGTIALIIGLIIYFLPQMEEDALQLTVYVTDIHGNVVLEHEGMLNTSIGNRPMRETIGEHGRTNFGDILPEYFGDTITIGFTAEGWEIANDQNIFHFSGKPIYLKIKKDDSLGTIKGTVKTRNGQDFIEGAKILINTDTTILTDVNGVFRVVLPESMRVKDVSSAYKLTISKEGYKTKAEYFYAKSSDAEIRLEKLN